MKCYNKLVRDKIPEICRRNGDIPKTRILNDDTEYLDALIAKIEEEVAEVRDNPRLEELADTLEVIYAIGAVLNYTPEQIELARARKAEERGGFKDRVFLMSTSP